MQKLSPLQQVRKEHGSKEALAEKVLAVLETPEGEDRPRFEHRIKTLSNTKLLRLWNAHQRVESKYGSKEALVTAIVDKRFSGKNTDYAHKISGFNLPKLLDLARQHGA